jgi:hypothetical protein
MTMEITAWVATIGFGVVLPIVGYGEALGHKMVPAPLRVWVRGRHRTRRVKPVKVAYAPKRRAVRGAA